MQRLRILSGLVVIAAVACGGRRDVVSIAPLDPQAAIQAFMEAVRDGDIERMSLLWGTEDGPAAATMSDRSRMQQRLIVIQRFLEHDSLRIARPANPRLLEANQQAFTVVLMRGGSCNIDVPFVMVRSEDGWLVQSIDLGVIGNPQQVCESG